MSDQNSLNNYGGRNKDALQDTKIFFTSSSTNSIQWLIKSITNSGKKSITPSVSKFPVLINNDLIVTGSILNPSDENIKKNIHELKIQDVDKLFILNPVKFEYIYDIHNNTHYGLIAQEVEKIYPELVKDDEMDTNTKCINYLELIPLMLLKMKQMQNEIDELKSCIK